MATRTVLALTLLTAVAGTLPAEDRPLDRAEIDKRAARAAYEAALTGTELYNGGDHAGCARLYQGTLQALLPMLDHRSQLSATIKEKLTTARTLRAAEAATVLREALDAIMGHAKATTSLWERLGGEKVVRTLVKEAGTAAATDPKVNFTRNGQYKFDEKSVDRMEQLLVEFVSAQSGGPLKYTGRDLGKAHKGMMITDTEFDALMTHLRATLQKHKIGPKEGEELTAIVEKTRKEIVEVPKK